MAFDWQPGKNYQITIVDALGGEHTLQIANPKTTGDPACQFLGSDGFVELPGGLYDPNMPPTTGYTPPLRGLFTVQWKDIPRQCWPVAPPYPDPDDFALRYDWTNITNEDVLAQFEAGRIHRMEDVTTPYTNLHQVLKEVIQADYAAGNKYMVGRNYTFQFTVKDTSQRFSIRITGLTILRGTPLYTQYCEQDGIIDNYKPEFWQHDSAYFQILFNWGAHRVALNQYGATKPDLSETTSLDGLGYECNPEGIQYGFFMWPSGKVCAFHNTKFSTEKDIGLNTFATNADHNFPTIQAGYGVDAGLLNITEGGGEDPMQYISPGDTGMISLYYIPQTGWDTLRNSFWKKDIATALRDWFSNPADGVISYHVLPFTQEELPTKGGVQSEIWIANQSLPVIAWKLDGVVEFDAGTIQIPQKFLSYLDFEGYTELIAYIPYVGYIPLDVGRFMGFNIGLKYLVDVLTGEGVAIITEATGDVVAQFNVSMARPIPVTQTSYGQNVANAIAAAKGAVSTVSGALSGNAAGAVTAGIDTAANLLQTVASPGHTRVVTTFSGMPAQLAEQHPFIVISRPIEATAADYDDIIGMPDYNQTTLANLKGFCQIASPQINIPGTSEELEKINSWLERGVLF